MKVNTMAIAIPASSLSPRRLAKKVDELGALNAQIAALQLEADAIKGQLKLAGYDEIMGSAYRAVISECESFKLDSAKVKALLSPAQIMACSKAVKSVRIALYDL